MDIPNIKNTKLGLQTLRMLGVPEEKLILLLNRADSKVQLDVAEVERTLGIKTGCLVPSNIVVPQSVNKGVPVVLDAPRSDVARALEELAGRFCDAPAAPAMPTRKGLGLFGRS
jgi:pilus assembly protein CpaE